MENSKRLLKKAIKKTTKFMLSIEVHTSNRIPEWFEQLALSSSHAGLNENLYKSLLNRLRDCLQKEYGQSAANFILR